MAGSQETSTVELGELESSLWEAANLLRGPIDQADFKSYVFPLLFFKRICDVYDEEFQEALSESDGDLEYAAFAENHRFQVPEGAHWKDVRERTENVGRALQSSMRAIEQANPNKLYGIFGDTQWTNKATIEALLVDTTARDQLGDRQAAHASLEHALDLAEPEGVILPFLVTPVRGLLERHAGHSTAHATLVSEILDVLAGTPRVGDDEDAPAADELTAAELRVVRYLPSNLKAPEIAGELFVSANTVRTHLRHIYAKLVVHNRGEAVARARELGLLAPSMRLRRRG